jgi:hypothetical protein
MPANESVANAAAELNGRAPRIGGAFIELSLETFFPGTGKCIAQDCLGDEGD